MKPLFIILFFTSCSVFKNNTVDTALHFDSNTVIAIDSNYFTVNRDTNVLKPSAQYIIHPINNTKQ